MIKQKVICDCHENIIKYARELQKAKKFYGEDEYLSLIDFVESLASSIESEAEEAMEYGGRMESRLQDYFCAIENLGFMRKK
jgi:hypothetical protein